jgi:hypothetical protein
MTSRCARGNKKFGRQAVGKYHVTAATLQQAHQNHSIPATAFTTVQVKKLASKI